MLTSHIKQAKYGLHDQCDTAFIPPRRDCQISNRAMGSVMINSQAGWEISAAAVLLSLDNISLYSCDANQCSCKGVEYCCGVASWHRSFLEAADPAAAPVVTLQQCAGCLVPRRGSAQAAGEVRRRLPVGNALHVFLPGRPILARPLLPGLSGRPAQWAVSPGGDRL